MSSALIGVIVGALATGAVSLALGWQRHLQNRADERRSDIRRLIDETLAAATHCLDRMIALNAAVNSEGPDRRERMRDADRLLREENARLRVTGSQVRARIGNYEDFFAAHEAVEDAVTQGAIALLASDRVPSLDDEHDDPEVQLLNQRISEFTDAAKPHMK